MKRLCILLLWGFMTTFIVTAQKQTKLSPEHEQEFQATVERITQYMEAAMAKLKTGDSTALAEVAALESNMAYVLIQSKLDYESALPWMRRCIERNPSLSDPAFKKDIAQAYVMMALYYHYGLAGFEKDAFKAFEWYEKAAQMGDPHGMMEIGSAYYNGQVVEPDQEKAFEWWLASAENGGYKAYRNVAAGYYLGYGVEVNYAEAVKWAEKGMNFHDEYCTFILGTAYYNGQGVEHNYKKAFELFNLSASQGEPSAYKAIAECYYYGRGVESDNEQAKVWCQKGIEADDEEAVEFMKTLTNE